MPTADKLSQIFPTPPTLGNIEPYSLLIRLVKAGDYGCDYWFGVIFDEWPAQSYKVKVAVKYKLYVIGGRSRTGKTKISAAVKTRHDALEVFGTDAFRPGWHR